MTKREAESFTAPYKFGRMGEALECTWGHTEWTATGSTAEEQPWADVQMDEGDGQLPVPPACDAQLPDGMHVEPELAADDAAIEPEVEEQVEVQVEEQGWSKRWYRRADGTWFYKYKKLKRALTEPN